MLVIFSTHWQLWLSNQKLQGEHSQRIPDFGTSNHPPCEPPITMELFCRVPSCGAHFFLCTYVVICILLKKKNGSFNRNAEALLLWTYAGTSNQMVGNQASGLGFFFLDLINSGLSEKSKIYKRASIFPRCLSLIRAFKSDFNK